MSLCGLSRLFETVTSSTGPTAYAFNRPANLIRPRKNSTPQPVPEHATRPFTYPRHFRRSLASARPRGVEGGQRSPSFFIASNRFDRNVGVAGNRATIGGLKSLAPFTWPAVPAVTEHNCLQKKRRPRGGFRTLAPLLRTAVASVSDHKLQLFGVFFAGRAPINSTPNRPPRQQRRSAERSTKVDPTAVGAGRRKRLLDNRSRHGSVGEGTGDRPTHAQSG